MNQARSRRRHGRVFDDVADEYDAARLGYPERLVAKCIARGGLAPGSRVIEVGCGTGKLTELLVAHGLGVLAVEPGPNMVEAARRRLGDLDERVRFEVATFEEARLPDAGCDALFSATAFHWVDPTVSWLKAARVLKAGGLLALLAHVHVHDERSGRAEEEFVAALARHAPDVAAELPPPRDLGTIMTGADERRENVSTLWNWVMSERHDLAVDVAAELFADVAVDAQLSRLEETAEQAVAHLRTTSLYFRIEPGRRRAFEDDERRIVERLGGTVVSTVATVLATARRTSRDDQGGQRGTG